VEQLHFDEMPLQRRDEGLRQHRHTVLDAFTLTHGNLMIGQVQVFHPQAEAFHTAEARTVQQAGHEMGCPFEMCQDRCDLLLGKDSGQAARAFGVCDAGDRWPLLIQHMAGQKEQCIQGDILGQSGYVIVHRQV
jgi:hypothetical protein